MIKADKKYYLIDENEMRSFLEYKLVANTIVSNVPEIFGHYSVLNDYLNDWLHLHGWKDHDEWIETELERGITMNINGPCGVY